MKNINSIEDLRQEKRRLRLELAVAEDLIREDFNWVVEELKPINIITKSLSKVFDTKKNGIIEGSIGSVISLLVGKTLFRNSSWITKLIVSQIIKNVSSNFIGDHRTNIQSLFKGLLSKVKSGNNEHDLYDTSTAQTNY